MTIGAIELGFIIVAAAGLLALPTAMVILGAYSRAKRTYEWSARHETEQIDLIEKEIGATAAGAKKQGPRGPDV